MVQCMSDFQARYMYIIQQVNKSLTNIIIASTPCRDRLGFICRDSGYFWVSVFNKIRPSFLNLFTCKSQPSFLALLLPVDDVICRKRGPECDEAAAVGGSAETSLPRSKTSSRYSYHVLHIIIIPRQEKGEQERVFCES